MTAPTYTSLEDEEFFGAIGRLTISWAHIECGLDVTALLLHHALNGREIEPEVPWSLQRKLKYIRKCFSKLEGFEIVVPSINALITEIKPAAEFRHDVIHGFVLDHPEGTGEATMTRLLRGENPNACKKFTITTLQVLEKAVAASKLAGRTMALATRLQELINMARESSE